MNREAIAKTVAITTLGCRANQYDSSAMEDILIEGGLQVVSPSAVADAYIINTCTVTGSTDSQSRQEIRKLKRRNKDAVIIVTGCYAEVSAEEVALIEGVDFVLGNPEKSKVLECIEAGRGGMANMSKTSVSEDLGLMELRVKDATAKKSHKRTRANLKIQDGCDRTCSFCIIPKARGASRSVSRADVLEELKALSAAGFREVILTGIHLGGYGRDFLLQGSMKTTMTSLLKEMSELALPMRLRISSLDPDEVTTELVDLLANETGICNHMHLALQSGSDSILKSMNRPYNSERFREVVELLAERVKDISIGADVIVGFPGESEADFIETLNLIEALPLAYLHVFPYSERSGTEAATMSGQVDARIIKERAKRLRILGEQKCLEFYGKFIDKEVEVLVESGRHKKSGLLKGRTSNYMPILIDGGDELKGTIVKVLLRGDELSLEGMRGVVV